MPRKKQEVCVDLENEKIKLIQEIWKKEINNEKSFWYRYKVIEHEVKKLMPKCKKPTRDYLKKIKLTILRNKKKLYSFTPKEDSEYLGFSDVTIYKITKRIKNNIPIGFIKVKNYDKYQKIITKTFILPITEEDFIKKLIVKIEKDKKSKIKHHILELEQQIKKVNVKKFKLLKLKCKEEKISEKKIILSTIEKLYRIIEELHEFYTQL